MKIISWNILANEFINKRYYPMIPANILLNRANRQNQIIITLRENDADIMLLQEVMQAEYNLLVHYFGKSHHLLRGKYITWQNKRSYSGNVTLLRKTFFNAASIFMVNLDFGLAVQCATKSGSPLLILNIHLDDISHTKRMIQMTELELSLFSQPNVILGGDFNEHYKHDSPSELYQKMKSLGLKISNRQPTYSIERPQCIDNILLKGILAVTKSPNSKDSKDVVSQYLTYGSDHLPVVVISQ
jgi:endonuclease/exonuclease/phosphatase family metal-dependent hydrolase